jgi:hypothetical protein
MAFFSCGVMFVGLSLPGCGGAPDDRPELGEVEGTIKMDEKPLVGASVEFQPESGRPSTATTDEEGHYELSFRPGVPGAAVGKHKVRIRTYREDRPDAEEESLRKGQKETVPADYNVNTTLTAEVKAGDNDPIDFNLKSGGKVIQPDAE